MQKLINVIALLSGLTSLGLIAGGGYLLLNKDAMIEDVREQATEEITKAITEALPGLVQSAMPKMPEMTGGVTNAKPAIPGL
jgi:hypothetical protein